VRYAVCRGLGTLAREWGHYVEQLRHGACRSVKDLPDVHKVIRNIDDYAIDERLASTRSTLQPFAAANKMKLRCPPVPEPILDATCLCRRGCQQASCLTHLPLPHLQLRSLPKRPHLERLGDRRGPNIPESTVEASAASNHVHMLATCHRHSKTTLV
jgi:hypothetical protein